MDNPIPLMFSSRRGRGLLSIVIALLGVCATAPSARSDDWGSLECDPSAALGAWSCAATACHGGGELSRRTSGGELERWRNADPHARSTSTMESDAFAQILLRLGIITRIGAEKGPGQRFQDLTTNADQTRLNECLLCHNPMGAPTSWTREEIRPNHGAGESMSDGLAIGCETCHGPAKSWIGNHFRRDFDREQSGFHDLKDPLVRARTCAQCHIGDGQRDMNHDMIAAGHPPLRFELAAYERALPKHWNDARQRAGTRDYEVKLWLAGQLANFDHGLSLLESRLTRSAAKEEVENTAARAPSPWPEFAESNCSTCHHRLRAVTESGDSGIRYEPATMPLSGKNWTCGALQVLLGLERPADVDRLPNIQADFRKLVDQRYRPLFLPEANVPADLLQQIRLAANYDQQLQAYAGYLAIAKSRYDEQHKTAGGRPPAALDELQALRTSLRPRTPGDDAPAERPKYDDVLRLFRSAAEKLE